MVVQCPAALGREAEGRSQTSNGQCGLGVAPGSDNAREDAAYFTDTGYGPMGWNCGLLLAPEPVDAL